MWYFWNVKITTRLNPCEFAKMITRELIIETATDLFVQHGVKTVTIDKIVKEMHTSKRTIYNHFEDIPKVQVNYCFFRSETESQISPDDILLSGDLFDELIEYLEPSMLI